MFKCQIKYILKYLKDWKLHSFLLLSRQWRHRSYLWRRLMIKAGNLDAYIWHETFLIDALQPFSVRSCHRGIYNLTRKFSKVMSVGVCRYRLFVRQEVANRNVIHPNTFLLTLKFSSNLPNCFPNFTTWEIQAARDLHERKFPVRFATKPLAI